MTLRSILSLLIYFAEARPFANGIEVFSLRYLLHNAREKLPDSK